MPLLKTTKKVSRKKKIKKSKKKRKKNKSNVTEFGVVQDDGLGRTSILLKIVGAGEDVKVSYDLKAASGSETVIGQYRFGNERLTGIFCLDGKPLLRSFEYR